MHDGVDEGRLRKTGHHLVDLAIELFGQTGLLLLVPALSLLDLKLRGSAKADREGQGNRLRRRA